ncbi:MAG: type II secretion system F family protein, partial [Acidimicrobiia bacterium]|nr:type II secretion system F family protein [Acidimicrobiia bacterium]
QELLAPLHERMLTPILQTFSRLGRRFNPPDYVETVRQKHLQAGILTPTAVERFLATRIICFGLIPVWLIFVFFANPLGLSGMLRLVLAAIGVAGLAVVPNSRLNNKVETRQKSVQRSLPDVLDLLTISVEAGLGFEQAVDRVINNVPGELSDEFARVLGETTAGSTRADALRGLQERIDIPEIRSFVMAMIQADKFGVSIGRVLRAQADEMRIKRRQLAQEKAQKAPVKMLIPMVFCIFPALFVVILGPALINIVETMG